MLETTALGAGLLAGLAVGVWANTDEAKAAWKVDRTFTPRMSVAERKEHLERWNAAVEKA
jgi:glycerol kinase